MIRYPEKAIERAVSFTADMVLSSAKENCPVRTGRLRDSISCIKKKDEAVVYTNVEYAAAVELGTSRQKACPYLSRGIDDAAKMAGVIFREEIFGND